jgi:hypothetical protein
LKAAIRRRALEQGFDFGRRANPQLHIGESIRFGDVSAIFDLMIW